MADGVAITAGSGTTIATDDCGSPGHAQIVKLGYSANGDATPVPAGASGLAGYPGPAASASLSSVNDTASNATILSSNSSRKGVIIDNNSTQELKIKYGSTASATSYSVRIPPGWLWTMPWPIYTGQIDGIWGADGSGAAYITELT